MRGARSKGLPGRRERACDLAEEITVLEDTPNLGVTIYEVDRVSEPSSKRLSAQHMKRLVPNRSAVASPNADISDLWCSLEAMTGKRARLEPNT